tara:strand:+ start:3143 stop:3430 length:288 start_codon:yes stop_codon:yes gene_type:complete
MINLTAAFHAKEDLEQELHLLLSAMIEPTRKEKGCLSYRLFKNADDAARFTFQEQFVDQQAFDFHCQQPYFQDLLKQLDGVLREEPVITFYEEVE